MKTIHPSIIYLKASRCTHHTVQILYLVISFAFLDWRIICVVCHIRMQNKSLQNLVSHVSQEEWISCFNDWIYRMNKWVEIIIISAKYKTRFSYFKLGSTHSHCFLATPMHSRLREFRHCWPPLGNPMDYHPLSGVVLLDRSNDGPQGAKEQLQCLQLPGDSILH